MYLPTIQLFHIYSPAERERERERERQKNHSSSNILEAETLKLTGALHLYDLYSLRCTVLKICHEKIGSLYQERPEWVTRRARPTVKLTRKKFIRGHIV